MPRLVALSVLAHLEQRREYVERSCRTDGRFAAIMEGHAVGAGGPARRGRPQREAEALAGIKGEQFGNDHELVGSDGLPGRAGLQLEKHNGAVCLVIGEKDGLRCMVKDRDHNSIVWTITRGRDLHNYPLTRRPLRGSGRRGGSARRDGSEARDYRRRSCNAGCRGGSACRRRGNAIVATARKKEAQGKQQE